MSNHQFLLLIILVENAIMESIGQIFWYAVLITPFVTIPLVWKYSKHEKAIKVILGIGLAYTLSFLFYYLSLAMGYQHPT